VSGQPQGSVAAVAGSPLERLIEPDAIARILATTVVATIMAGVVTKVFGPKAGFIAFLVTATGHAMFDAPLTRRVSNLGI
jgi:hypothetical protein